MLVRLTTLAVAALLLGGCITLKPADCKQFDVDRKQLRYDTEYRLRQKEDVKPLTAGESAAVALYRIVIAPARAQPCSHLEIHKTLHLARKERTELVLEETREIFTARGTRIATKTENLSRQLDLSGRYDASVPLPIPKNAPPGRYRVVSTLALRPKSGRAITLARSEADFEVVPVEKK